MTFKPDRRNPALSPEVGDAVYRGAVAVLRVIEENEEMLGRLDAYAGDGDHGSTVVAGLRGAVAAMAPTGEAGPRIVEAGRAFAEASGGASGALYGSLIEAAGRAVTSGDGPPEAVRAGLNRVQALGKAEVGDKTMIDALRPFCDELDSQLARGGSLGEAWALAASVAIKEAAQTALLVARRGRSSKLGERSLGGADPGATSAALALAALAPAFLETSG